MLSIRKVNKKGLTLFAEKAVRKAETSFSGLLVSSAVGRVQLVTSSGLGSTSQNYVVFVGRAKESIRQSVCRYSLVYHILSSIMHIKV